MQHVDKAKQTLLLSPDDTPTGLGIAQYGSYIYPVSACHEAPYDKNLDGGGGHARCTAPACRNVNSRLTTFATSAAVSSTGKGLTFFLTEWTGLSADQFDINLGV